MIMILYRLNSCIDYILALSEKYPHAGMWADVPLF